MISIIITTYNRSEKIGNCLKSILDNHFADFEVIVVDQSDNQRSRQEVLSFSSSKIRYFKLENRGKSRALNFALSKVKGDLIAFTDDDCIVDKYWLRNIANAFDMHKEIVGVYGAVLPYKVNYHKGEICPALVRLRKSQVIKKPLLHGDFSGANNAFSREIFKKLGGFKEYLGPGSLGKGGGEDREFNLRVLFSDHSLLAFPKIRVYHDRWLSEKKAPQVFRGYLQGDTACFSYLMFKGKTFGKKKVKETLKKSWWQLRLVFKSFLLGRINLKEGWKEFKKIVFEFDAKIKGIIVGLLIFIDDVVYKTKHG